ncbi:hypothetical protein [Sphingobium yanoikuyae]|uniref:hypothetical protein n=1 Tax=Sphingobium yanoikuyae TaxID=13690 RepID=UPI0035B3F9D2
MNSSNVQGNNMIDAVVTRLKRLGALFIFCVVIPVICSALYFGVFASDVFLSESSFVVRSPEKQAPTGIGMLLKSSGIGSATDEIGAVETYVKSRDALQDVNKDSKIKQMFSRNDISAFDRFSSFGFSNSFEDLFKYYKKHVDIENDTATATAKLTVRAYSARDAFTLNERLLEQSEKLVNTLNERARVDLISYAQRQADEAEDRATQASLALSAYRNEQGVVDPEMQAPVQLQMISKLQDELIATKTQLVELRTFTPQNPTIAVLQVRIQELSSEIDAQLGKVAGDRKSLSSVAARYQRLRLESQFADRQLAAALGSLTEAKNDARRKQVYVERIVQPNMPDEALEPRRLRGILATLVLGLIAWGILSFLMAGIREHND